MQENYPILWAKELHPFAIAKQRHSRIVFLHTFIFIRALFLYSLPSIPTLNEVLQKLFPPIKNYHESNTHDFAKSKELQRLNMLSPSVLYAGFISMGRKHFDDGSRLKRRAAECFAFSGIVTSITQM